MGVVPQSNTIDSGSQNQFVAKRPLLSINYKLLTLFPMINIFL